MWGPLNELGDDIDLIDEINRLPKLNDIDDIPLSQLMEKLHQAKILTMSPVQKRHRNVTFTLGGLMILLMTGVGAVGIVYWRYIVSKASYMILECIPLKTLFQRRG